MAAAHECFRLAPDDVQCSVLEASARCGGTVLTRNVSIPGAGTFIVELGPDGWVSEKPWATEMVKELGLADEIVPSNDAQRKTFLLRDGSLQPFPEGMRLMAPTDLAAICSSTLLSAAGKAGYLTEPDRADELRKLAENDADISVADFVRRHFGEEATRTFAAPLLAGVFGGDIERLSARSVMPQFCAMEKEHGSLIRALQAQSRKQATQPRAGIFSALRSGNESLVHAIARRLPADCVRLESPVALLRGAHGKWRIRCHGVPLEFDAVLLATPLHVTAKLLADVDERLAHLHAMPASSGVLVALLFSQPLDLPGGFGFLVEHPQRDVHPALMACTFSHQKYPHSAPSGGALLRVFFGGPGAGHIESMDDAILSELAVTQLRKLFPALPAPTATLVQRWPHSLPQYEVGHAARVVEIEHRVREFPGLFLMGNAYRGVGLPDMVKLARERAAEAVAI